MSAAMAGMLSYAGPPPVEVGFAGPSAQRRLTVAFRVVLAIPHFVLLMFLSIAVVVVEVVGWFAALVLGQLPQSFHNFISGAARYYLRVYAYMFLLTDRYPPFSFESEPYPVDLAVSRQKMSRLGVLFRLIFAIPANIVAGLANSGVLVVLFFAWLIALVAGRLPVSLHQAFAATLRYQARFYAYLGLLTPTYPGGLFGDDPAPAPHMSLDQWAWQGIWDTPPAAPPPAPEPPQGPPLAPPQAGPWPPPTAGSWPPPTAGSWPPPTAGSWPPPTAVPYQSPMSPYAPIEPLATRLVLTKVAKRLIVLFLVLGAALQVGDAVLRVEVASATRNVNDSNQLSSDYLQLRTAFSTFQNGMSSCQSAGGIACAKPYAAELSAAFSTFAAQVDTIAFPPSVQLDADSLSAMSRNLAETLNEMASASSNQAYDDAVGSLQSQANEFDTAYTSLQQRLLNG